MDPNTGKFHNVEEYDEEEHRGSHHRDAESAERTEQLKMMGDRLLRAFEELKVTFEEAALNAQEAFEQLRLEIENRRSIGCEE